MDLKALLASLDAEIAQVAGFPPEVLDLPQDLLAVRVLNRMLIISERSKAARRSGACKVKWKPSGII